MSDAVVRQQANQAAVEVAGAHRRVYKYPLLLALGPQEVWMPAVATIVHVHEQNDRPCLWVEVNTSAVETMRVFEVFATGEDVSPVAARYVGTVHVGWTVWHVYEHRVDW